MTDHHRVTEQGKRFGLLSHRMAELGRRRLARAGVLGLETAATRGEMCASCAYRPGTVPNGCLQTQLDALKAVVEGVPFRCHSPRNGQMCAGWLAARAEQAANPMPEEATKLAAKWQFSPPDDPSS